METAKNQLIESGKSINSIVTSNYKEISEWLLFLVHKRYLRTTVILNTSAVTLINFVNSSECSPEYKLQIHELFDKYAPLNYDKEKTYFRLIHEFENYCQTVNRDLYNQNYYDVHGRTLSYV